MEALLTFCCSYMRDSSNLLIPVLCSLFWTSQCTARSSKLLMKEKADIFRTCQWDFPPSFCISPITFFCWWLWVECLTWTYMQLSNLPTCIGTTWTPGQPLTLLCILFNGSNTEVWIGGWRASHLSGMISESSGSVPCPQVTPHPTPWLIYHCSRFVF